jgi:hypothetical protein
MAEEEDGGFGQDLVSILGEAISGSRHGEPRARAERRRSLRAELTSKIKTFARSLTWSLRIRGQHYSGLGNQELFDILAAQGRDFGADTSQLRTHVANALIQTFAQSAYVPLMIDLEDAAADAILEWIVMRFNGEVRDVRLKRLSKNYREWKQRHGLSARVGVAHGDLRENVADFGHVKVRR